MKVTWGLENASYNPKTITTIGSYDGMHQGHIKILHHLTDRKEQLDLERSLVITFSPHPQEILQKNNTPIALLTTIEERLALLEKTGIDESLVIRFSLEFAKTPYNDFFQHVLINTLGTKAMVVGFNHAFGKNREGDTNHLKILAAESRITIEEVPPLVINNVSISSTKIRHALIEGNIGIANEYLGRPYEVSGVVEEGDKIGRTIGFPTANIRVPKHKLIPSDGVYGGRARINGELFVTAISIGTRPTITDKGDRTIEAYILDFNNDIYGQEITLQFLSFLRLQKKFETIDELKAEIDRDIIAIRSRILN